MYQQVYDSNYESDSDDYVAAISSDSVHQLEPLNVEVQIGEIQTSAMIDSGSAVSILTKSLANRILQSTKSARWTDSSEKRNLKTFSNEPIKVIGHLETTVTYNHWKDVSAMLTVADDGHKNIIGRDLFGPLRIAVVQQQPETGKCVNNITNSACKIKETVATRFPHLVSRIGLSKTHVAKSKFHQKFTAKHQKGRRVPINHQPRVTDELERLQTEGHIEKLSSCSDENFISPIVITVKKDQSIKLALDSKVLNKAIHKNKYQMPNIEMLIDTISQHLTSTHNSQQAYFTTLDLKYAYSQLKLHHETAKHCNFNIICGESTGTYRFKTGFYGLTDMPAEFQKAMDYTLVGLQNTYCFLDDIIIVSTGTEADHLALVFKCLQKLDYDNLRINLQKCHFAKSEIEWLGYKFTQTGISPLESKTAAILTIPPPTTLKRLRSFLGSVHYIGKFIPHLAQLCHPLRPLLKKSVKFVWTDEHTKHFNLIKEKIANSTENSHYNPKLDVRVKCNASRSGLGAALEQKTPEGWKPIAFASRFLNTTEERYSVNELELLGIVWSIDYFKYYLYGKNFTVVTDHRALLSILKEHRSNKSYNSRLSRWIDRLLPYNFTIEHMPGAKMGLVDYISRNPFATAKKISTYDEHFVVATISKIRDSMKHLIVNKETTTKKFQTILKSNMPPQQIKPPFAPRLTTQLNINSTKFQLPLAPQLTTSQLKPPFASQLTLRNSNVNTHFDHPFAPQMPLKTSKLQFVPNQHKVNNSHSISKFAAKEVQMSDSKECEQSEQLVPIQPINGNKATNPPNNTKLSAKIPKFEYKYHTPKNKSLFAQIQRSNNYFVNKENEPLKSKNTINSLRIMSKSKAVRSKSTPAKARVTFSDTTPSTPESNNTSRTETPTGSMIDETDDLMFHETLQKVFSKKFLAILTGKDAILKEVRDCVLRDDAERLQEISPYLHSYWRDLSVKNGCVCLDERIAIPKAIKDAVLEDIHSTHPGSFAMLSLAQNIWWPYIHRDILAKASECKACTEIGKNLKPVISHRKWTPLPKCSEPNEEIQLDFGGPILNEKGIEQYFITSIDRYSKYPTAEIVNNASGPNVVKFLNNYIYQHGVPRTIRLDQAKCFTGKKFEIFCAENNITPIYAPANDHRAVGLVERIIQTIKRQLSCMKSQLNKKFHLENSLKAIIQRLRISKQKTLNITPFEAHFGRKCNTPISNITTKPNNKNLNYNAIINYYLDEDTIPGRSYLTEEQWADTALCSDTEIEKVICAASSRARLEQEKRKDGETRFINPEAICREMPCSERSIQVKLARKRHESQRQKKNLDGLYEVLAPGSTVCKISPTTSVIKEPYKQEVRVRNSDIAKFGTRAERETKLIEYIDRRPQKITEKTLEQKIQLHKKDLIRKNTGDKKIKRDKRQADDVSIVSSGRSCISTTSNIARSLKMRIPKRNPKYDTAFLNRPDLVKVLNISLIAPQMDDSTVAGPSASQTTSPTPTHPTPILKKTSKRNLTISDTSDSDTSSVRRSKRTLKKKKTQTIVEKFRNTEGYVDDQDIETVGDSYQSIDDRQEQPREMTVLQAETAGQSDSE